MRWSDLDQSIQSEREELTHKVDITEFPVVATVKTPSNTVHHLQVTGWRLGAASIELIIEQGDSNATSETSEQQARREYEEYNIAVEQVSGVHPIQKGTSPPI